MVNLENVDQFKDEVGVEIKYQSLCETLGALLALIAYVA